MAEEIKKEPQNLPAARYPDPFHAMRSEMDRLFENFMGRGFGGLPSLARGTEEAAMMPRVDVRESDGEIVVEAELPGLEEKDIDVTLRDGILRIKGERQSKRDEKKDDYHITERTFGRYERAFRLPDGIDEDKITADLKNGILHIAVPKKAEAVKAAKKISVGNS